MSVKQATVAPVSKQGLPLTAAQVATCSCKQEHAYDLRLHDSTHVLLSCALHNYSELRL